MKKLEYIVSFTTPAFLGNDGQQAQWRAPPFKALIRQWWRVVKAKEVDYDHRRILQEENRLFGSAADDGGGSHRSLVRFRLSTWGKGTADTMEDSGAVCHPEVHHPALPGCPDGKPGKLIRANAYLGFGPVGILGLTHPPAIRPDFEKSKLFVLRPPEYQSELGNALQLAAWFGTLGSRSRNGWGGLQLSGENIETIDNLSPEKLKPFSRNLEDCLQLDWSHAVGRDGKGPLIWKTQAMNTWREAMRELARLKIAFRTQFKFTKPGMNDRHILAYPVTHHNVPVWGNQARLANQIRFKVSKTGDKYLGVVFHLPCRLPDELASSLHRLPDQLSVWQSVHEVLEQELGASSKPWRT